MTGFWFLVSAPSLQTLSSALWRGRGDGDWFLVSAPRLQTLRGGDGDWVPVSAPCPGTLSWYLDSALAAGAGRERRLREGWGEVVTGFWFLLSYMKVFRDGVGCDAAGISLKTF